LKLLLIQGRIEEMDAAQSKALKTYGLVADQLKLISSSISQQQEQQKTATGIHNIGMTRDVMELYLHLAHAMRRMQRFEEASSYIRFANAINKGIETTETYLAEGRIMEDKKKFDEAQELYQNSLIMDSNNASALHRLGVIAYQRQHYNKARIHLQNANRLDSENYECWYDLGMVLKKMDCFQEASDCFLTSLQLYKSTPIIPIDKIIKRRI